MSKKTGKMTLYSYKCEHIPAAEHALSNKTKKLNV